MSASQPEMRQVQAAGFLTRATQSIRYPGLMGNDHRHCSRVLDELPGPAILSFGSLSSMLTVAKLRRVQRDSGSSGAFQAVDSA